MQDQEEEPSSPDEICVLDAVVCVHFVGANLQPILIDVLESSGLVLQIPEEVCDEVAGKDHRYPGLRQRWARLQASERIQVLPRIEVETAHPRVVEVIEEIRGIELEQAVRINRDLGEVIVIAHCVRLAEQRRNVMALIDDQGGQALAARWGIPVLTIENVLTLAIHRGHFPNRADLRKTYDKLREYGDGMLPLEKSGLIEEYQQWEVQRDVWDTP
ncbi:hypothetical protein AB0O34_26200 [Sphaerisporangium sp. NPDC088356]|uniref:hypothetical protein n=1 Tax=Sphaerisporangium sp. NPDC088356 TaxID=3154871 RepID=UPI003428D25B